MAESNVLKTVPPHSRIFPKCPKCGKEIKTSSDFGSGAFPQPALAAAVLIIYCNSCGGIIPYTIVPAEVGGTGEQPGEKKSPFII